MLSLRAARRPVTRRLSTLSAPAFSTTAQGDDPELDRDKPRNSHPAQRAASTLIDSAPGWNEDLATASEAFVKADRETSTIDEMQQKTVGYVQSHHHDPEVEQTHAAYAREEVNGPLGSAGVGEFEGLVGHGDLGLDEQVESNGRVVTRRVVHEGKSGAGQANKSD